RSAVPTAPDDDRRAARGGRSRAPCGPRSGGAVHERWRGFRAVPALRGERRTWSPHRRAPARAPCPRGRTHPEDGPARARGAAPRGRRARAGTRAGPGRRERHALGGGAPEPGASVPRTAQRGRRRGSGPRRGAPNLAAHALARVHRAAVVGPLPRGLAPRERFRARLSDNRLSDNRLSNNRLSDGDLSDGDLVLDDLVFDGQARARTERGRTLRARTQHAETGRARGPAPHDEDWRRTMSWQSPLGRRWRGWLRRGWFAVAGTLPILIACAGQVPPSDVASGGSTSTLDADELLRAGRRFARGGDSVRAEHYLVAALERGAAPERVVPWLVAVCIEGSRLRA